MLCAGINVQAVTVEGIEELFLAETAPPPPAQLTSPPAPPALVVPQTAAASGWAHCRYFLHALYLLTMPGCTFDTVPQVAFAH